MIHPRFISTLYACLVVYISSICFRIAFGLFIQIHIVLARFLLARCESYVDHKGRGKNLGAFPDVESPSNV
jgi:hypothetical protein